METYFYANPNLDPSNEHHWLHSILINHVQKEMQGNIYRIVNNSRKILGYLATENLSKGMIVYVSNLEMVNQRLRPSFKKVEEKFLWNIFYQPRKKWYETQEPNWRFWLVSPRESVTEISEDCLKTRRGLMAACKNTDWIWTGYNGGLIDLYKEDGGRMTKFQTIRLQHH